MGISGGNAVGQGLHMKLPPQSLHIQQSQQQPVLGKPGNSANFPTPPQQRRKKQNQKNSKVLVIITSLHTVISRVWHYT